jgi:pyruvate-formate lyase-activating enzyme
MVNPLTIRESLLQQQTDDTVRCGVCERRCLMSLGGRGWCQNWEISQRLASSNGSYLSPEQMVEQTRQRGCRGTSISFNEPTLALEWSPDVFRLARG